MTFKDCSVCYEKWKFNSHFLHLDIEYFEILRGRGGPSRSLEGGALNGNSTYISYIWILNILKSLGGGGAPAALWRVAHLMEIQVTSKKCRKCKFNFH
jgi:hypothetical protein